MTLDRLPDDLPVPCDDGAAAHLEGMRLPSIPLQATDGRLVDLATEQGLLAVFVYPRTGRPGESLPDGWDLIPGARGCTPQACAFRDLSRDFAAFGCKLYGLSVQDTDYQREMAVRLHLPFSVLSDKDFAFSRALNLPMFQAAGLTLLKRLSFIARDGLVTKVFYPVFPPDKNAGEMLAWLNAAPSQSK